MYPVANSEQQNQTAVSEFILLGFGDIPKLQIVLFVLFFIIYLATMTGNLLIVLSVSVDQHLHTPMYFFLGNLSFLESSYSTTIMPKMLAGLLTGDGSISVKACLIQFFIFSFLGGAECYLLSVMSYDRYLAVSKPLHYATVMNGRFCMQLAAGSWVSGILVGTSITVRVSKLSFCGPNEIDHYFCDMIPDIKQISCSDTHLVELSAFTFACIFTLPPFLLTLTSYTFIIATILRIQSITGRQKAFSTCSSHLIVVALFYGTLMLVYMLPRSRNLRYMKKIFSLFYTVLTPMVNPLIYSLRNKEVKKVLGKGFRKFSFYITFQKSRI
ncbi:olfactory receptor 10A7-like [Heteronotia binoei]|uniref:olfactory receptor 10A7-like n=1 Tax=Heteronotia binoei TaxID=13085 RepID=UPI00292E28F6|nr:olfactory receptor 10A7-like [Heteronotia binoei]